MTVVVDVREPRTDSDASPVVDTDRFAARLQLVLLLKLRLAARANVLEEPDVATEAADEKIRQIICE